LDDHPRVSAVSGPQQLTTQDHAPGSAHAGSAAESALAQPLAQGLFTLPEEEETVVRAVPERILALSRVAEIETKTIAVPRELLELSRRDETAPPSLPARRVESELPVWDAWYGSAASPPDSDEPVFDLRPSRRGVRSAGAWPEQRLSPDSLSPDDALLLEALAPTRRVAARALVLILAALCVVVTYWGIQ
jgi:hypothetical protein